MNPKIDQSILMPKAVDSNEIDKFNKIAPKYWDPAGPMQALHQINPLRIDFVESFHPLQDSSVLDVGCGGGLASEALARRGAKVLGIDGSEAMLAIARSHAAEADLAIDYQYTNAEVHSEGHRNCFDIVTCFEMLEHVTDPTSTLNALCAMVKPGGVLICSTINRTLKAYFGAIIAAEYILNWVPQGTHNYSRFLKPSEICAAIRPQQMIIESIEGIIYQPAYRQFKRDPQNLNVNYQLAARKQHET